MGAFSKLLPEVTISFVMSVHLSVRVQQPYIHWTYFLDILYWVLFFFTQIYWPIQFWLEWDKNIHFIFW